MRRKLMKKRKSSVSFLPVNTRRDYFIANQHYKIYNTNKLTSTHINEVSRAQRPDMNLIEDVL